MYYDYLDLVCVKAWHVELATKQLLEYLCAVDNLNRKSCTKRNSISETIFISDSLNGHNMNIVALQAASRRYVCVYTNILDSYRNVIIKRNVGCN
jgi:hypothetical protein